MSATSTIFQFGQKKLNLAVPAVMGVLNVTPDSFSDGGRFNAVDAALRHAELMIKDGAAIIDIGGESTRPGAAPVSEQEELDRVIPVVEAINKKLDTIISIDTSSAAVIRQGAASGASLINDVRALQREGALSAAVETGLPVCLMHMQGQPDTMQEQPDYRNVLEDVADFFQKRLLACQEAGIAAEKILLDPGFGFGKSTKHNLVLLNNLNQLADLGYILLVGLSRKSILGTITGRTVEDRLHGSIALATLAAAKGARIIRAHDVAATVDAMQVVASVLAETNMLASKS